MSSSSLPFKKYLPEAEIAILSVLRACHLTSQVQQKLVNEDTILKKDKSPVTGQLLLLSISVYWIGRDNELTWTLVADLSAQALITLHLQAHFKDLIIGEEDTTELRANGPLRERVVELVDDAFAQQEGWGKDQKVTEDQ